MWFNFYCFRCIKEVNKQRKAEKLIRILYHTDAAQGIGKMQVDVDELNVDYLTIVGHKVVFNMCCKPFINYDAHCVNSLISHADCIRNIIIKKLPW
jgi:hypothetical protein